ncbi:MAG: hypothetical protein IN808_11440 [Rubrobacter sp.]|nr:hypothetical protein [Rubrobacter sp.]
MRGVKLGFIGYNDPLVPKRQSPSYSKGIKFTFPEANIAEHIRILREQEGCELVFVMTHMGLAQQVHLANQSYTEGADYILGADTHERIREQGYQLLWRWIPRSTRRSARCSAGGEQRPEAVQGK